VVDEDGKMDNFLDILHNIFEEANSGGLITIEKAEIIKYISNKAVKI
jgi:PII-like signaling protein